MKLSNAIGSSLLLLFGIAAIAPGAGCAAPVDPRADSVAAAQASSPVDGPTGQDKAKLDDWRNCTWVGGDNGNDYDCAALHAGTDTDPIDTSLFFTLQTLSKDQRGIIYNTGNLPFRVFIEQGLAWSTPVLVNPGGSANISPIDDAWYSWSIYSVVITDADGVHLLTPDAKARVHIGAFTPAHTACNDDCMSSFSGCMQGCGMNDHGNGWCQNGCETEAGLCLDRCQGR